MSIREALRELELWGAGAVFTLTAYVDSSDKEISIIKDWKDLVNQVMHAFLKHNLRWLLERLTMNYLTIV